VDKGDGRNYVLTGYFGAGHASHVSKLFLRVRELGQSIFDVDKFSIHLKRPENQVSLEPVGQRVKFVIVEVQFVDTEVSGLPS